MNHELWQRVNKLFNQLADLPADEQVSALEQACQGDSELYYRVLPMLNADRSDSDVLDASVESLSQMVIETSESGDPEFIDAYRLVRKIGSGGMGVVYEAVRDDGQFTHRVALKRIKHGMDTEEIIRRFRNERQILANLEHPNIARLLDGGIYNDAPYFVMEFVEGNAITDYADSRRLDVDARLKLFLSVCSAVQHAHQNLVVHRDLKPSNILITEEGEVKLLDFGIAKVLDPERQLDETITGQRLLTPAYASPEQLQSEPVTTASDVFSLGVVLYELLTSRRPFASSERRASMPSKPSTMVSQRGENHELDPSTVSRSSGQAKLARRLSGDIDTIVLKALHPEADRRYQSADQFLDDIKRHLAGLPVTARPDTISYRAGKFVRRHRYGVGVATLLSVLLLAFAVVTSYQQQRTAIERDAAEEVALFLESMFDAADPFAEERLDTLRVNTLLDRGAIQINENLGGQPEVRARMLHIIGRVNGRIGRPEQAEAMLQEALDIRSTLPNVEELVIAETYMDLGDVQYERGLFAAADSSFAKALAIRNSLLTGTDPAIAEAMGRMGRTQHRLGNLEIADSLYTGALRIQRNKLYVHADVAVTLGMLASLHDDKGDYQEAESLHVASLAMRRDVYEKDHPAVALGLRNYAIFMRNRNRYEEAEPLIREAITISRETLGGNHPNVISDLNTLAGILRRKGDYAGADSVFREVLHLRRTVLGARHPDVSITLDSYARVLKEQGDYARAVQMQEEAIDIAREVYGDEHMSIAITTGNLASILRASGDPTRALPAYQKALALYEKLFSPDHPNVSVLRSNTAGCLIELGRYQEAEGLLEKSLTALMESHGAENRLTQSTLRYLVTLYSSWGKPEKEAQYAAMVVSV